MKRFFLITIIIISLFECSYSQNDFKSSYIIKNKVDTIFGTGLISKNQEYCLFKKFDAKEYTKLYPTDIDAFRVVDGKYYVSKQVKDWNGELKWYFLEYLVHGKIDLFTISNDARFFIQKENEGFQELNDKIDKIKNTNGEKYLLNDKRYIGYIKVYMSDAPSLYSKIDNLKKLNQSDLVDISIDYHNAVCNDYKCTNYTKVVPKVTYKMEILTGVNRFNSYYTPQFGVLIHIWRPIRNERLYLKLGILYSDRPYAYKDNLRKDINKRYYNLKFPISFQYVFGKKALKPTLAIGSPTGMFLISSLQGGFIYSLSDKSELSLSGSIDGLLDLGLGLHKDDFNNNFAHTISFGYLFKLN
ncbi:MAG: hypothetical protein HXX16_16030 [Bacteroidales bacterium]|nr:hypothetical protein [Bacteroidales bacterium]